MQTSDSIVIIPTYNERENIENIIRAVFGLPKVFHILVIEDGSPDGTATIVKNLQQEFPERLFMIERKGKLGLGTAYITGFKWALEHTYEYIFEMDADFSHNPNDLPRLYQACAEQGGDVSIGSRYVSGVNVVNWPMVCSCPISLPSMCGLSRESPCTTLPPDSSATVARYWKR